MCDELQTLAEQISKFILNPDSVVIAHSRHSGWQMMENSEPFQAEDLIRDFPNGILRKGLYAAPSENPVSQLLQLREKDSIVYLL